MNVEEQRLADWLQQVTPEPPRAIGVEDVAEHLCSRPKWRLPALAAAAVVMLVAALVLGLRGTHQATPPAHSPSPTPSPTTSSSSPAPASLPIHPWNATQLGNVALVGGTTTVLNGRLYAEGTFNGRQSAALYRLDPSNGARLAQSSEAVSVGPVTAAGLIWCLGASGNAVLGFDPITLAEKARVAVDIVGRGAVPSIATLGSGAVVLGAETRIVVLRNDMVAHRLTLDATLAPMGIAANSDGSRLYVAVENREPGGRLETLDPNTGVALAAPKVVQGGAPRGLQSTSGGLWYSASGGHQDTTEFWPNGASSPRPLNAGASGGGIHVTPTVSGGAVWLGGYGYLGCADPTTGTPRARTPVGTDNGGNIIGSISGLTVLNKKLYAVYSGVNGGPANALIVMTPPTACFTK